jgi:putative acetyltransferase
VSRIIRSTTRDDRQAILVLVREAFSNGGRDGSEEVDIVKQTWSAEAAAEGLDLVAVEDGEVRGHVLGAHGDLGGRDVVGVAPLAVVPSHHHEGIGTALMTELLGRAERAGLPFVVLLGNPDYYGRFGFEPSGPLGIVSIRRSARATRTSWCAGSRRTTRSTAATSPTAGNRARAEDRRDR